MTYESTKVLAKALIIAAYIMSGKSNNPEDWLIIEFWLKKLV